MADVPSYLKKGDTILVIATARARDKKQIEPAIKILKSWGLNVELGKNIYKKHHQFAGTDKERAEDFQWAVDHKSAKAILIAGGGYGNLRIIDQIRLEKLGIPSLHSTMAFQFTKNEEATLSIKKLLFGEKLNYHIPKNKLNIPGVAKGKVVGGNLSMLYALSGSADDLSTEGKILFIEDLDEQLYHIDRMMLQLKRSGKLKNLKALVVGGMSDMKDNVVPYGKTAEEIILDAVKEYNYPVCFNFPAGHIEKNLALYLGKKAKLKVTASAVTFDYL
jgi:muramoyltetrapeptide carboxypeptidase